MKCHVLGRDASSPAAGVSGKTSAYAFPDDWHLCVSLRSVLPR